MQLSVFQAYRRWDKKVTIPIRTLSRQVYPRTILETLAWAQELYLHHGLYSQAIRRAVRYFLTRIEVTGTDLNLETRAKYKEALSANFGLLEEAEAVGCDLIFTGNSFTSLHQPFIRNLICSNKECSFRAPLKEMAKAGGFNWERGRFMGKCPICHRSVEFGHEDMPIRIDQAKPIITHWPPQYMEMKQHVLSKRTIYSLNPESWIALTEGIKQGDLMYLEDTPWELIQAVFNNQRFEFADGMMYHSAMPTLALQTPALEGWGLPPFMSDFETAVLLTLLDKYSEAILIDYLVPFRVLSPPDGKGAEGDPMLNINVADFMRNVLKMIDEHRRNPTRWNVVPYPLNYQVLGGEAKNLVPADILAHYEQRLLSSIGVPRELYGSTENVTLPVIAFRMFERNWRHVAARINNWLTWLANRYGEMQKWEKVKAQLTEVAIYDDPTITQIKLQLNAGKKISDETALAPLGIDAAAEPHRIMDEQDRITEMMEERAKADQQKQMNKAVVTPVSPAEQMLQTQQGAPAPGASPVLSVPPTGSGGTPGTAATIDQLMYDADGIAQQLLTQDSLTRRRTLADLKHSNETLYGQVKMRLDQLEQQAQQTGVSLVRQGQLPLQ